MIIFLFLLLIIFNLYGIYSDITVLKAVSDLLLNGLLLIFFISKSTNWENKNNRLFFVGFLGFTLISDIFFLYKNVQIWLILAQIFMFLSNFCLIFLFWNERNKLGKNKIKLDLLTLIPVGIIFITLFVALVSPKIPTEVKPTMGVVCLTFLILSIMVVSRKVSPKNYYLVQLGILLMILGSFTSIYGRYVSPIEYRSIFVKFFFDIGMFLTVLGVLED